MLELEVVPERSLGNEQWEFVLGMSFYQAVHIIQQQARTLKGLQVLYSDLNPLAMDLVINLSQDGIRLIFDPLAQRLKIIEVYNMNKVKLKYCGIPFNSPEIPPTFEQIDRSFGATHPGVYDESQQLFVLSFRGLSFSFPVDSKFQLWYTPSREAMPFPSGSCPVVTKMSIYTGNNMIDTKPPPLPECCFYNHCYLDHLDVIRENNSTIGLKLYLNVENFGRRRLIETPRQQVIRIIRFGDSCQEVTGALGSPSKVFYKAEDKMKIHSPNAHKLVTSRSSDYFFNYYSLGLDILFDARTHSVTKFILHTNYPGHYNFNIYYRCDYKIVLSQERTKSTESIALDASEKPPHVITAFTKWDTIQDFLLKPNAQPVILNRSSSTNTTNPFGSTICHGYQDMIFEVMQNKHIASLTLYHQRRPSSEQS